MPSLSYIGTTFTPATTGKDTAALTLGTQEPRSTLDGCRILGRDADWALKMPGNTGSRIHGGLISGGKDRALDIVQGSDLIFEEVVFDAGEDRRPTPCRLWPFKTCDIGIKAGARGIALTRSVFTDLLIGDYSIYNHDHDGPKTDLIEPLRSCRHPVAGQPIIIRVLWGIVPRLEDTHAVILKVPDRIVQAYFAWCRRLGDTRRPVPAAA